MERQWKKYFPQTQGVDTQGLEKLSSKLYR